jgi:hypothetical protein
MAKFVEWDFDNPVHRQRRRRQPRPLEGEILEPDEPSPRIRVEISVRRQPQRQTLPTWLVVLLIVAGLLWISPIGLIVAIAIVSILAIQHPLIVITSGLIIAALVINSLRKRSIG